MAWTGTDPGQWARETKERLLAVFRASGQELANEMTRTRANGGNVPVKTGNLARSLLAQKGAPPRQGAPGVRFAGFDIGPVLLSLQPGDTLFLGYQANYARRMNYGFVGQDSLGRTYNQAGFGFVERAAAKWPQIVTRVVIDMRVNGGAVSSTSVGRR